MSALIKPDQSNAVAVGDGFDEVPREGFGIIRGHIVQYADAHYLIGKTEPADGRELAVTGVTTAWDKWRGKEVEHRITEPGQYHPERDELGDLDQSIWEIGLNGRSKDPWQDTRYLYLIDPQTGEELTFITATAGGRKAVGDLASQIRNVRRGDPGAIAIIRLESTTWKTRFGIKPRPSLKVVGWKQGRPEQVIVNNTTKKLAAPPVHHYDEPPFEDFGPEWETSTNSPLAEGKVREGKLGPPALSSRDQQHERTHTIAEPKTERKLRP